ncbi:hydantoinase/oxoprolinase family protein [Cytobacillus purgationiresistens]|uniref:Hydantoinase/oxoprolinase family protein n=1 Tax=Cytobacillus purgationiresistens TaxID=863449 RepID=A0ABU0ANC3_9BACI|nr:hydantoinase/oxoprolinase family protein [Cytobacillus purgationiresistens]MDQ0272787.1 hypothetical protein [Cytobacillus purgationiresistens]
MRLGIDVGGTNTDAVVVNDEGKLFSWAKHLTTVDIISGIHTAASEALSEANIQPENITGVFLGTTHVVNALFHPRQLAKTALVRIVKRPSAIKPGLQWPDHLKKYIKKIYQLRSNNHYTGSKNNIDIPVVEQLKDIIADIENEGIQSICIVGSFSPLYESEEVEVQQKIREYFPYIPITMSHEIGSTGFLERENASLLNAILSSVIREAMVSIAELFKQLRLECPYWLTQNDGSLMEIKDAMNYPILTIGSGVTNSLRGAAILSKLQCCIVVDVGGSTIDIGRIINGHPEASVGPSTILNIPVNVRMPRIESLPYGGGSLISMKDGAIDIEDTIASDIEHDGMAWGGECWTLTDSFLKVFPESFNDEKISMNELEQLSAVDCRKVISRVSKEMKDCIARLQLKNEELPVVLVGGGSPLLAEQVFGKYEKIYHPAGYPICNALGACFAPLSAEIDKVFWLNNKTKQEEVAKAKNSIIEELRLKGATKESIRLISVEEFPFDYLKGDVLRIRIKGLGEIK